MPNYKMKPLFRKIWNLALPYQDKRGDEGHAETVLNYAFELLKTENSNEDVVIPAAILHDIGWSQVSEEERMAVFRDLDRSMDIKLRMRHQELGVILAKDILVRVNYPQNLTDEVLEIISQHDTRQGFLNENDGIMRDADKLWRYSSNGFSADLRRFKIDPHLLYQANKITLPNYFYSITAKRIAQRELEKRKSEIQTAMS